MVRLLHTEIRFEASGHSRPHGNGVCTACPGLCGMDGVLIILEENTRIIRADCTQHKNSIPGLMQQNRYGIPRQHVIHAPDRLPSVPQIFCKAEGVQTLQRDALPYMPAARAALLACFCCPRAGIKF